MTGRTSGDISPAFVCFTWLRNCSKETAGFSGVGLIELRAMLLYGGHMLSLMGL